jgi:hypothetical protein
MPINNRLPLRSLECCTRGQVLLLPSSVGLMRNLITTSPFAPITTAERLAWHSPNRLTLLPKW